MRTCSRFYDVKLYMLLYVWSLRLHTAELTHVHYTQMYNTMNKLSTAKQYTTIRNERGDSDSQICLSGRSTIDGRIMCMTYAKGKHMYAVCYGDRCW
jgi:hypothetical protein